MRNAVDYRWKRFLPCVNEVPVDIMLKESKAEPWFIQEDHEGSAAAVWVRGRDQLPSNHDNNCMA